MSYSLFSLTARLPNISPAHAAVAAAPNTVTARSQARRGQGSRRAPRPPGRHPVFTFQPGAMTAAYETIDDLYPEGSTGCELRSTRDESLVSGN